MILLPSGRKLEMLRKWNVEQGCEARAPEQSVILMMLTIAVGYDSELNEVLRGYKGLGTKKQDNLPIALPNLTLNYVQMNTYTSTFNA